MTLVHQGGAGLRFHAHPALACQRFGILGCPVGKGCRMPSLTALADSIAIYASAIRVSNGCRQCRRVPRREAGGSMRLTTAPALDVPASRPSRLGPQLPLQTAPVGSPCGARLPSKRAALDARLPAAILHPLGRAAARLGLDDRPFRGESGAASPRRRAGALPPTDHRPWAAWIRLGES